MLRVAVLKTCVCVRFAVVTAALLRIHVFCDITLCHQVSGSNVFKDLSAFAFIVMVLDCLTMKKKKVWSFKTSQKTCNSLSF